MESAKEKLNLSELINEYLWCHYSSMAFFFL